MPYVKAYKKKLNCLQINSQIKFINIIFKSLYNKKNIIIDYIILYMQKKLNN